MCRFLKKVSGPLHEMFKADYLIHTHGMLCQWSKKLITTYLGPFWINQILINDINHLRTPPSYSTYECSFISPASIGTALPSRSRKIYFVSPSTACLCLFISPHPKISTATLLRWKGDTRGRLRSPSSPAYEANKWIFITTVHFADKFFMSRPFTPWLRSTFTHIG